MKNASSPFDLVSLWLQETLKKKSSSELSEEIRPQIPNVGFQKIKDS